jgi:RNA polymerase sigma-70 factor (ECF subfamily)
MGNGEWQIPKNICHFPFSISHWPFAAGTRGEVVGKISSLRGEALMTSLEPFWVQLFHGLRVSITDEKCEEGRRVGAESDESVMLSVRKGDVDKLGVLFERHHPQLFNYLLRLTGDRHASEDLVQEVFVRILKYRHTYRGECQFTTWMFQIARNARIDLFRRGPREEVSIEDNPREHVSPLPSPHATAQRGEEMEMLLAALAKLPEESRDVLLLRGFQGLKFEEIARVMKCSVNTVKGRAFRAVRELRASVQRRGETAV